MRIYRSKIKKIIFEFTPPENFSQGIIILCEGLPSVPGRKDLMTMLANKGFIVVFPRYRGTWESGGEFLRTPPTRDIEDILQVIQSGVIVELYSNRNIKIPNSHICLLGSSFGGSVALSLAKNKDIHKIVALSPIVDFKKHNNLNNEENLISAGNFIKRAFGQGYRFKDERWIEMIKGKIFNPPQKLDQKTADKILIGYGKLDHQVNYKKIKDYASNNKIKQIMEVSNKGHLTFSNLSDVEWNKITEWLSDKK